MTPDPHPGESRPPADSLLDTLRHPLRRAMIRYFEHDDSNANLDELVTHLAANQSSTSRTDVTIQLVHNHLPKLAARGWIDYDPETEEIQYRGHETAGQILDELRAIF